MPMDNKILKELQSVLTQFLYGYYEEVTKSYSEENAKLITYEAALELLRPFMSQEPGEVSLHSLLKEWEEEWLAKEKEAISKKDYDTQEKALDILGGIKQLLPYADKEGITR